MTIFVSKKPTKRLFWKIWIASPKWADKNFQLHWVEDQICGFDYAGLTVFGWSLIYSDYW